MTAPNTAMPLTDKVIEACGTWDSLDFIKMQELARSLEVKLSHAKIDEAMLRSEARNLHEVNDWLIINNLDVQLCHPYGNPVA